jgi:hypothetical protein
VTPSPTDPRSEPVPAVAVLPEGAMRSGLHEPVGPHAAFVVDRAQVIAQTLQVTGFVVESFGSPSGGRGQPQILTSIASPRMQGQRHEGARAHFPRGALTPGGPSAKHPHVSFPHPLVVGCPMTPRP